MDVPNDENFCGICYENLVDPRVLPCWHVACLRCILGMTQVGQSRAVSCHICRKTLLFENIRSLPRPINCKVCGNFVKNPKKFPCCSDLYCTECVRKRAVDGLAVSRSLCTTTSHPVNELLAAKLCPICFILHTEPARDCGHSTCNRCHMISEKETRPCSICEAVATPNPFPVNPQAPVGNILPANLPRFNIPPGQQLDPANVRLLLQIAALAQQMNRQNEAGRIRQPPLDPWRYNQQGAESDVPKAIVFYIILLILSYCYGLCFWTWIVSTITLLALRPRLQSCTTMLSVVSVAMLLLSLYHYFNHAVVLLVTDIVFSVFLKSVSGHISQTNISHFHLFVSATVFSCTVRFFEPIFVHRSLLAFVITTMSSMLQTGNAG